jgi:putative endonuclease
MGITQQIGLAGEKYACAFLQKQGLTLVAKNHRNRYGEIDLIMKDKQYLVFVEVRLRNHRDRLSGLESVDFSKQQKLTRTAECYLQQKKATYTQPCRFDVLDLQQQSSDRFITHWVKNAFDRS